MADIEKRLPKWLRRTDAEVAAEDAVQAERRAGFGRGHLTEAEQLISRGALLEQTARGNLTAAEGNAQATKQYKAQLAEAMAMQGRYTEAARHHPDKQMTAHYRAINKAIGRSDTARCRCPDTRATIGDTPIAITPRFERQRVFSVKHRGLVSVVECSQCGDVNVRPLARRLLQARGVRAGNLQAARTDGRGATRDVDLLKVNERAK